MSERVEKIIVTAEQAGARLDTFVSAADARLSRSHAQNMIGGGLITVNDKSVKNGYKLVEGDIIELRFIEAEPAAVQAEPMPIDVVYEDADIIVVNKPQGMVVHPAFGHSSGTLVNALLHHCGDLSGVNGVKRPGIVHRIDKDTSGLLVAAKNDAAHLGLTAQWKNHDIKRQYHALVEGLPAEHDGVIDAPVGRHPRERKKMAVETRHGRDAVTEYRVLERFYHSKCSYVELTLQTGRTHQIRVHMAYLQHPLIGDTVYGLRKQRYQLNGQALHAKTLGFKHPISGAELLFDSPLPEYFQQLLAQLRALEEHE
ncbi:MAG: RluA family pseudouridine synthase [Bacillota bacterium]|nr:RluA family pseudouridine synthase [Bacillota bacterium]